jgi:prepilin-type N-terminal cleavage/methylation domain-containing protein
MNNIKRFKNNLGFIPLEAEKRCVPSRPLTGFTLIEVVITMAIMALIMLAMGAMGSRILRLRTAVTGAVLSQEAINQIITPLMIELRSMQPSNTGSFPIESASTSSLIFYSDTNKDGMVERLRYFLQGNILKRGIVVPSGNPVTYNLANEKINNFLSNLTPDTNGIFAYYADATDINGVALASPPTTSAVKVVKLIFIVDQNPGQAPGPLRFNTSISPRNLRSN